ncbi:MAG: adenylate/guanylate cyclase domain-containing protein [Mycolicibacterium hassiacum]
MTASAVCPRCGAEPRPQARFCDSCGARLSGDVDAAEYKQVTVLFADVVRSMDIAEAVGAERLRELMTELVRRSSAVVTRYGGTMNQFTGDGFMALFGAPVALEDHAQRACRAALAIQAEASKLATEIRRRDGIILQLRIGLNSGEVVVGDVDAWPMKYTASGQQVGMAQRMESVAAPGGVMLSEATARLVADQAILGRPRSVHIKGVDKPVTARSLVSVVVDRAAPRNAESRLIGRERERAAVTRALRDATFGRGGVVAIAGPPGIGKSRLVRESVQVARSLGAKVFYTYCESHTRDVSFHVIARAVRSMMEIGGLAPEQARAQIRLRLPDETEQVLALLDELLSVRGEESPVAEMSAAARRRRLVELLTTAVTARPESAVYVVEDVHWIDDISESLLADLAAVLPRTRSVMLVTYRPEYRGALRGIDGTTNIVLAPLDESDTAQLVHHLVGDDPSVAGVAAVVSSRAAGVPFFAEEIVRDLAERGILRGSRGAYRCAYAVSDVAVPATLQAAIGARIDRLGTAAKRTLHAAAVIGAQFDSGMLTTLCPDPDIDPLLASDLVEKAGRDVYAFRHPLIQKVAHDSQLRSDRAKLHRRLACAIEQVDANAGLIATHWEAAGEYDRAYEWHMRAGSWFNYRDLRAARTSWQRARAAADRLPADASDRLTKQIAPRTLICATTFRVGGSAADTGYHELRRLAAAADDTRSLAIGMAGYLTTLAFTSHHKEASALASELHALAESIADPTITVGLVPAAAQAKYEAGELGECLRFAQRVIDLAGDDAAMGDVMVATPLAWAYTLRGTARMCLGHRGWLADLDRGLDIAMAFDLTSRCNAALYKYVVAYQNLTVLPDDSARVRTAEWLRIADESGDPTTMTLVRLIRGVALVHSGNEFHDAAMQLLFQAHDHLARLSNGLRRLADVEIARVSAARGNPARAIATVEQVLDEACRTGEKITRASATTVLVESLLDRGGTGDLRRARTAVDALAADPAVPRSAVDEVTTLRLRARMAAMADDTDDYFAWVGRYRAAAEQAGFIGHLCDARAMAGLP